MGLYGSKPETAIFNLQGGGQIQVKYYRSSGLGFTPWPGTFALGSFLEKRAEELRLGERRVLELGSGACTVAGLVACYLCKEVTLTDRLEVIHDLAAHAQQAEDRGMPSRWEAKVLDWTDLDFTLHSYNQGAYDIILMADVVYFDFLWKPLLHTLLLLCSEETQVLWTNCDKYPEYMPDVQKFMALVEPFFNISVEEDREQSHCDGPSATAGGRVAIRSMRLADKDAADEELQHSMSRSCARRCFF